MPIIASGPHALGRNKAWFVREEVSCGTPLRPRKGADVEVDPSPDLLCVLSTSFEFTQTRTDRVDCKMSSRSFTERITGRREVSWTSEMYVIYEDATGGVTEPQATVLIKNAMGVKTQVADNTEYSLTNGQTDLKTMTLYEEFNRVLSQQSIGSWVEEMAFTVTGGEDPKFTFSGGALDMTQTGRGVLAGNEASAQTLLELEPGGGCNFEGRTLNNDGLNEIGSPVMLTNPDGSIQDNNADTGYVVTAADKVADEITIDPQLVIGGDAEDLVVPWVPTNDAGDIIPPSGDPIPGIVGRFKVGYTDAPGGNVDEEGVGGSEIPVISFNFTMTNNIKPLADEAFKESTTDFIPGMREVTGEFVVRARKDQIYHLIKRKDFERASLFAEIGDVAGKQMRVFMPEIEFDFSSLNVPESEEVLIPLPFKAFATSETTDDELKLIFVGVA